MAEIHTQLKQNTGVHEYPHGHEHPHGQEHSHGHEHPHGHTHSHEHTKAVLNRLAKIIGHLKATQRMVENGRDCSEVLIQLAAIKASVNSAGKVILKDHIEHCIVDAVKHNDTQAVEELNRAIDRFMK